MTDTNDDTPDPPRIPKPPSRQDLDIISRDQALITDEWAGNAPETPAAEPADEPPEPKVPRPAAK